MEKLKQTNDITWKNYTAVGMARGNLREQVLRIKTSTTSMLWRQARGKGESKDILFRFETSAI